MIQMNVKVSSSTTVNPLDVGFEVFTAVVMKSIIFWICHLLPRWLAEPISSTLKMEAICSSETSVETQWTTGHHIPEDDTLQPTKCFT
jgi:hypothetical protein